MNRRVLITGMEGFAGSHLAEYALRQGAAVHGTAYPGASRRNLTGLKPLAVHALDITDAPAVERLFRTVRPDRVFHLAGQSSPAISRRDPEATLRINILGTLNVLESANRLQLKPRVLVAGSADEYGCVDPGVRTIPETYRLNPETPYAVSKVCQDLLALTYFRLQELPVIRVRPFNHIGARQAPGFVATDFASQIAAIERRQAPPILAVGNLDVIRDFSDVRDIVRGYWRLLEAGRPGEAYNLGSGKGIAVRAILEGLLAHSDARVIVKIRREKIRSERQRKVASIAKTTRDTGWKPAIPLAETLAAVLGDWRERTRRGQEIDSIRDRR